MRDRRWWWPVLAAFSVLIASRAQAQAPTPQAPMYAVPSGTSPTYAPASAAYVPLGTPAPTVVVQPGVPAADPAAPPPRARNGNMGLIIAGAALLGAGWVLNLIGGLFAGTHPGFFGLGSRSPEPEWAAFRYVSLVPVAGPWIQLAIKPTGFDQDEWGTWLIIDGLMQAAGTALLIAAAVTDGGDDAPAGGVEVVVIPGIGPGHASLTLAGRF